MSDKSIEVLGDISEQINRYVASIIFIFGVFGNILNCLILSQRSFRLNPCAFLLLVSSIFSLMSILVGVPTRILNGWNQDPTSTINWACKARAFIVFSTRTVAIWLIVLATMDRWLISSRNIHHRQLSTLKNTKKEIYFVIILSVFTYCHMLPCYEVRITDAPLNCYGATTACRLITDIAYIIITILLPLILMLIFGLWTISQIHHTYSRVHNTEYHFRNNDHNATINQRTRKADHNLLQMLSLQVFLLIVLCVPQAIQKFYITMRPFGSNSQLEVAIKAFIYNIDILLAFVASAMPFYIYVLVGENIFRKAFLNLLRLFKRKMIAICHRLSHTIIRCCLIS